VIRIWLAALLGVIVFGGVLARMKKGDLFRVAIPRTLDKPLAMGTRLDIAAALAQDGVSRDEIRTLVDGAHDRELLARYWSAR
jgi:hypothetical protein